MDGQRTHSLCLPHATRGPENPPKICETAQKDQEEKVAAAEAPNSKEEKRRRWTRGREGGEGKEPEEREAKDLLLLHFCPFHSFEVASAPLSSQQHLYRNMILTRDKMRV